MPITGISSESAKKTRKSDLPLEANLPVIDYNVDYVVVGGGMAGTCSAITAARAGLKVVLIQDRPVNPIDLF